VPAVDVSVSLGDLLQGIAPVDDRPELSRRGQFPDYGQVVGMLFRASCGSRLAVMGGTDVIRTPDQRLRVFVSSTLQELAAGRRAVLEAVTRLRLVPVMFELGARPHPARSLYRACLVQSQVFVGIYWQSYGWVAPGERISGLEDEYGLSAGLPRLIYVKSPAPDRDSRLTEMLARIRDEGGVSYQHFSDPAELGQLVQDDLAVLLSERFEDDPAAWRRTRGRPAGRGPSGTTDRLAPGFAWPVTSRCAHSAASWAGRGLRGETASAACSAVMTSPRPSTARPSLSPATYSGVCCG
jgi:hypothetical protein